MRSLPGCQESVFQALKPERPSVESLVSIASALQVSPDDLLFNKDDLLSQIMHFYKNCSPKEQKLLFTLSKETLSILHDQNIFLDNQ